MDDDIVYMYISVFLLKRVCVVCVIYVGCEIRMKIGNISLIIGYI